METPRQQHSLRAKAALVAATVALILGHGEAASAHSDSSRPESPRGDTPGLTQAQKLLFAEGVYYYDSTPRKNTRNFSVPTSQQPESRQPGPTPPTPSTGSTSASLPHKPKDTVAQLLPQSPKESKPNDDNNTALLGISLAILAGSAATALYLLNTRGRKDS